MSEAGADLYRVPNRETLRRLSGGMEIVRAIKHEPIGIGSLSVQELVLRTDSYHGSKFLPEWPLPVLVDWIEANVEEWGWRFPPGVAVNTKVKIKLDRHVGYVEGRPVRTITVTASGRWVHAYPDKD